MTKETGAAETAEGRFITIEGIDGCGKSTQAKRLCEWLDGTEKEPEKEPERRQNQRQNQKKVLRTFEPGGWSGGEFLRRLLLEGSPVTSRTELLLFLADRSGHLDAEIEPALLSGRWVVCERYTDSTLAYQSWGRGIALREVEGFLDLCRFRTPDLTILLDIGAPAARARLERRGRLDRIESELDSELDKEGFMARVAQGYRELAKRRPERIAVLDAASDADRVFEAVQECVLRRLRPGVGPGRNSA
ncbi:MAG: dTMP kinase [Synergistaceae bacterium]|nr:dTMP kinase [Synergistaceae bacterium]